MRPTPHLLRRDFRELLEAAARVGLDQEAEPGILWSRTALLRISNPGEDKP